MDLTSHIEEVTHELKWEIGRSDKQVFKNNHYNSTALLYYDKSKKIKVVWEKSGICL